MNNVKSIIFVHNKAVIIKSANPDKDKKNIVADVRKPDMCSMAIFKTGNGESGNRGMGMGNEERGTGNL